MFQQLNTIAVEDCTSDLHTMNRRYLLHSVTTGITASIAGCGGDYTGDGTPEPRWGLTIIPSVRSTNGAWQSRITLRSEYSPDTVFHDVTVHLYAKDGALITKGRVGEVDGVEEVELLSDAFPSLITATAAESPCDERVNIGIAYWNGTTEERSSTANSVSDVWTFDTRQCNESLPPERLVNDSQATETEQ